MPRRLESLSADEARRIAIGASSLAKPRPTRVGMNAVESSIRTLGVLQIDSVNVFVRAHHMPAFSRLGPYPMDWIDALAYRRRRLFEYWAHVASYVPIDRYPLWVWKMRKYADPALTRSSLGSLGRFVAENPDYIRKIRKEVERSGPLSTKELEDPGKKRGPWWGWAQGKMALEWLFFTGEVTVAERRGFTRYYDLTERVIPSEILARPAPVEKEAKLLLVMDATAALGVGTVNDIADYYRFKVAETRSLLEECVAAGSLMPVSVEGWGKPSYLHASASVPRRLEARALLSPFDPLVWFRPRAERIFDFHYRIEIYTPQANRQFGYYTLPFLYRDRIAARVDLKHDRRAGALLVRSVHPEDQSDPAETLSSLGEELTRAAEWVGARSIVVEGRSALARQLRKVLSSSSDN